MPQTEKKNSGFLGGVFTAFLAILLVYIVQQRSDNTTQQQLLKQQTQRIEELKKQVQEISKTPDEKAAFPDYFVATEEFEKIVLSENHKSYVDSSGDVHGRISKKLKMNGKIARGYLLVEAITNKNTPLTVYDSIYTILGFDGGHLYRSESLETPQSTGSLLLYPLRDIPYLTNVPYDEKKTPSNANWTETLNKNQVYVFQSFLSSRVGGTIKRLWIAYECDEETPECELEVVE